jgi:hypothetical protein
VPGTGGFQIGGIDQGQRQLLACTFGQQGRQEFFVDLAQPTDSYRFPKLVQHPHVGHFPAIGQVGEATPASLLG